MSDQVLALFIINTAFTFMVAYQNHKLHKINRDLWYTHYLEEHKIDLEKYL